MGPQARYGWDLDTWDNGAHMREWMDSEIAGALDACWTGFSGQEMAAALSESVGLFDPLGTRTAIALGIEPFDGASVVQEIDRVMRLTGGTGQQPDARSE
jgi:hypothetical protein